jgi:dTDP-4-dehydrorhamnose reductase
MNRYDAVLITGGMGMLAHAVRALLQRRGVAYAAVDIDTHDLTRRGDVQRLFEEVRPTLVLNCAAYTAVDKCEQEQELCNAVNGDAVGMLAEFCKAGGAKLVHVSTDFVFDGTKRTPYTPEDEPNPVSAYGRSKLLGEQKLREVDPPGWVIARTAWLYGPSGNCFPKTIVNRAREGAPLRVVEDQHGSPTYTFDLAEAMLTLVDHDAHGIWHLTNSGQTSWFGFTKAILEEFGLKTDLSPQTAAEYKRLRPESANRPAYSVLDNSAYERLAGKPMRQWREGLRDYRSAVEDAAPS